jgi:type IV pilus assembly protein PilC
MSLTFTYRARDASGQIVAGTMRSIDRATALAALRERRLVPSELRSNIGAFSLERFFRRAPARERLAFFRAYAALEEAGIDFSTAFGLLSDQARTRRFRDALQSVRSDVERGGERLWRAMSHRPDEFTDLEVAMVAAGEEAGNRAEIFDRIARFLERDQKFRKQLSAALFYPAIVVCAAILVTAYLLFVVVPQFANLFAAFDVHESALLDALLFFRSIASSPRALAFGGIVAIACVAAAIAFAQTPGGAMTIDRSRLALPLIGPMLRKAATARLARVLATLLESGVNQLRALEVASPVAESPVFAQALELARQRVSAGACATLDEALALTGVFEPMAVGFVRVGSQAGDVPGMLLKISEYYEDDVEALATVIPTLAQTFVTLGLGVVVAFIVYVVYVPLTTLATSVR